jgi:type I restriction enzyme, R subunit
MAPTEYSEDLLIEQPAIELFGELDYETANCFHETFGLFGSLGRENPGEVVLVSRLRPVLEKFNPELPSEAITQAVEELANDRSALHPVLANKDVYKMLKDGVRVSFRNEDGDEVVEYVKVIDWNSPDNNDFFLASQFWVTGEIYKKRADLVGFVNGLPLILVELKASHVRLENAYRDNLYDYKQTIPQLFWYNNLIILSNGNDTRVGTISSAWEHFNEWKKINSEGEEGTVSLETAILGTCEQSRLLDLIENFTLFFDAGGANIKMMAKNHQYLGVNNAIEAVKNIRDNQGKLGVFWHTQGSGKSFSMVFFTQKILRKIPGNWTFLIVTDRKELDKQIYKNFAGAGAVTEEQIQAQSVNHLKQLLQEDHRNIFTLIQKFQTDKDTGEYPLLSDRSDIIVITDEAHRSQYDTLAMNMRKALPNAAFIAFTGTPLIVGEEKTRQVFGDYISVYNFRQSVEDKATVPLYYENRIPELQLVNEDLDDDLDRLLEEAELNEEQEKKLEREFSRQYHLLTRDDRLNKIAEDIVSHFMGRGHQGKAMVISIDRFTAVRMYDKVQIYWKRYIELLKESLESLSYDEQVEIQKKIAFMQETDMAVVISSNQNEVEAFRNKGLDITPHRLRMVQEDLETKFKDPDNPFRIVFVCAMWMTGFDVQPLSTIYLDKPMRNHTLMQAIARANRVFRDKNNGLIVDYVGIFRNLQKALAIYGPASGGGVKEGDTPVDSKEILVKALKEAISETKEFCVGQGVDVEGIIKSEGFQRIKLLDEAAKGLVDAKVKEAIDDSVEKIIINDEYKKQYLALAGKVVRLYKAVLPDPSAQEFAPHKNLFSVLADKIRLFTPETSIEEVMEQVEGLLDESIAAEGYVIREPSEKYGLVDLSKIDFEALKKHFEQGRKRTLAEQLRSTINSTLQKMVLLNKTRLKLMEKFQKMIDEYNSGSANVELFFDKLLAFVKELKEEEKRGLSEELTEEELAVFDLLTKDPEQDLTEKEKKQVKKTARELLNNLKKGKLVLDWRKRQQSRAQVLTTIQDVLDQGLPRRYSTELYRKKCDVVYQHVYESYYGSGRSIYANVS